MRAVGMHHWGPPKLIVDGPYILSWEPECPYDPGNAMAIYDSKKKKRAYITRNDALILSTIWSKGLAVNDLMTCRPISSAHCVCYDLGPQHECIVGFRCKKEDLNSVRHILDAYMCQYNTK
jgi:hypothetical protein